MKIKLSKPQSSKGFTLIEMIGVLAVIAILASLLIPKIFEAINNARVNNAAVSIQTVKTAVADHYAKFGSLASSNGIAIGATTEYDTVLLNEGFLDKSFAVKISNLATNALSTAADTAGTTTPTAGNTAYNLDGASPVNDASGSFVVEALIYGVALEDARALDRLIDGLDLSYTGTAETDLRGRVKWAEQGTTDTYDIRVYVTHR